MPWLGKHQEQVTVYSTVLSSQMPWVLWELGNQKKKKRLGMGGRESGEGMKLTTRWPPDGAEKTFSLTSLSHLRWKHKSLLQPSF